MQLNTSLRMKLTNPSVTFFSAGVAVFLVCFMGVTKAEFRCYTCVTQNPEADDPCVVDPVNVPFGSPITPCTKKYCTIYRRVYRDNGKIADFMRGCLDRLTEVDSDPYYTYKYFKCTTDLCNGDDGSLGGGGGGGNGGVINIIVPDFQEESASASTTPSLLVVTISTLAVILMRMARIAF